MFGITLRAAGTAVLMVPLAGILGRMLEEIVPLFGAPSSMLATTFNTASDWSLTIGLLACLVMLIASAVTESEVPR